jgi:hypothetical protein
MKLLPAIALALLAILTGGSAAAPPTSHLVVGLSKHDSAAVVSIPGGRIAERGLGEGTLDRSPLLVVGGRLIYVDGIEHEPQAVSLALSLAGETRTIGPADVVMPSATPGRLWLGVRRNPNPQPSLSSLREVTLDGRTTLAVRHETPGDRLVGAVDDGLVFARAHRLVVWDPRTGRQVRAFSGRHLVATHGARLAMCRGRCFGLLLAGRRRSMVVRAPAGRRFLHGRLAGFTPVAHFLRMRGAFSPDGSLLAVPVEPRGRPRIALLDTRRGTARFVPRARLQGYAAPLAWSPSGDRLYYASANGRVFTYVPGTRRAQQLDLPFQGPIAQLIVAG